jgi:hypothetical protein
MTIYKKAKSLGFVRIANLAIAAVAVLGLAYAGFAYAEPGNGNGGENGNGGNVDNQAAAETVDFCHAPADDITKAKKFMDEPLSSWENNGGNGHNSHTGDFLILDQDDEDLCDAIIAQTQCADGIDNTDAEDTLIDAQDPGCHTDGNASNAGSYDPLDDDETNIVIPPAEMGSITIQKSVTGTSTPSTWSFSFSGIVGLSALTSSGSSFSTSSIAVGSYVVTEGSLPANWTNDGVACTGDTDVATSTNSATIDLDNTENVVCTFTNHYQAPDVPPVVGPSGSITIVKAVTGTSTPSTWSFSFSGLIGLSVLTESNSSFSTGATTTGSYVVTEGTLPANWTNESVICSGDADVATTSTSATIDLDDTEDVTCTFTNHYQAPDRNPNTSTISGQKWNDVNGNGTKDEGDNGLAGWIISIFANESLVATTSTDGSGNYSFINLDADLDYWVCEDVQGGWAQTSPVIVSDGTVNCTNGTVGYSAQADEEPGDFLNKDFGNHQDDVPSGDDDDDDNGGGGGSSRRRSSSDDDDDDGEVLGAQTTTIPAGVPNTGFGGMSGMATGVSSLGTLLSLFGGLAVFAGKKEF